MKQTLPNVSKFHLIRNWIAQPSASRRQRFELELSTHRTFLTLIPKIQLLGSGSVSDLKNSLLGSGSLCTWNFLTAHAQMKTWITTISSEINFKQGNHALGSALTAAFGLGTDLSPNLVHAPLNLKTQINFFQLPWIHLCTFYSMHSTLMLIK